MSVEDQLREALRPVDPEEGFADRVMSRLEPVPSRARKWPVAIAASLVMGVALAYAWHVDRERRGAEARRQLIEALHIAGQKLDLAYRGVKREGA